MGLHLASTYNRIADDMITPLPKLLYFFSWNQSRICTLFVWDTLELVAYTDSLEVAVHIMKSETSSIQFFLSKNLKLAGLQTCYNFHWVYQSHDLHILDMLKLDSWATQTRLIVSCKHSTERENANDSMMYQILGNSYIVTHHTSHRSTNQDNIILEITQLILAEINEAKP